MIDKSGIPWSRSDFSDVFWCNGPRKASWTFHLNPIGKDADMDVLRDSIIAMQDSIGDRFLNHPRRISLPNRKSGHCNLNAAIARDFFHHQAGSFPYLMENWAIDSDRSMHQIGIGAMVHNMASVVEDPNGCLGSQDIARMLSKEQRRRHFWFPCATRTFYRQPQVGQCFWQRTGQPTLIGILAPHCGFQQRPVACTWLINNRPDATPQGQLGDFGCHQLSILRSRHPDVGRSFHQAMDRIACGDTQQGNSAKCAIPKRAGDLLRR